MAWKKLYGKWKKLALLYYPYIKKELKRDVIKKFFSAFPRLFLSSWYR